MTDVHLSHVMPSFSWGNRTRSNLSKFLLREKSHMRMHDKRSKFLVRVSRRRTLDQELGSCVISLRIHVMHMSHVWRWNGHPAFPALLLVEVFQAVTCFRSDSRSLCEQLFSGTDMHVSFRSYGMAETGARFMWVTAVSTSEGTVVLCHCSRTSSSTSLTNCALPVHSALSSERPLTAMTHGCLLAVSSCYINVQPVLSQDTMCHYIKNTLPQASVYIGVHICTGWDISVPLTPKMTD